MSFSRLRYHVVFGTRRRKRFISSSFEEDIYDEIENIVEAQEGKLVEIGGVPDHVHLIVAIPPATAVSEFVKEVKRQSSIAAKEIDPRLSEFEWQRGFGVFSVSRWEMGRVIEYVRNQKDHHGEGDVWAFLERVE